jgi:hypothetical protein
LVYREDLEPLELKKEKPYDVFEIEDTLFMFGKVIHFGNK